MTSKDAPPSVTPAMVEKGDGLPAYEDPHSPQPGTSDADVVVERDSNFWTRNGLNFESFKERESGAKIVHLDRSMKTRHLHMIAIGGSIGAGFFVGSGGALASGGPGALFVCFAIVGVMMFNVVHALGEMAVMYPISGSFYTYSTRFIDPSWGFAMGWNYVFQWAIVLPFELTVCAITFHYWARPEDGYGTEWDALWITIFLFLIVGISVFGTLGYAEEEFWSSALKLAATVIFIIIAFILVLGGGPADGRYNEYWGARYWYEPGAFTDFRGFCGVFVTAAFSFAGTELVGLAAAESANPVRSLPGAIKQVFWRITLFYILGLFFVGLLIDRNDPDLLSGEGADSSPFVLVGKYAGLDGFDHFMNVIILVSVTSIGISSVYGGSRCLTALAQEGYAPKIFTYIDKSGRPLWSLIVILIFCPIAYVNIAPEGGEAFNWLLALSGLAALFTWGSICLAHIRFRAAWALNGHTLDEIPFKAAGGVIGSYIGLALNILILIAVAYTAIDSSIDSGSAEDFFKSYLAFPIVIVFWIGGYFWKKTGWLKVSQIDVNYGRRNHNWDEINAYRQQIAALPAWRRLIHFLF